MTDMLVNLYNLKEDWSALSPANSSGVIIRKPIAPEKFLILQWVRENFSEAWASEVDMAFSRSPVSCFIAQQDKKMAGFACYDATSLGYFGPTGVAEILRGKGIGKALLLACLLDMKLKGYGYAIIGSIGPQKFYEKTVGATVIPGSTPGIWKDWLCEE